MKIGLKKPRTDLAIKHIMLIIDGKEYYISFHYSLRKGIKDVCVYGEPAKVIDAYPALPELVKICAVLILIDIKTIVSRIVRKMKDHSRLRRREMEIDTQTAVCVCQHIKAYFRQCADNEKADWGEPCADCKYALEACKFNWFTNLMPLFKETGIAIRLGRAGHSKQSS